MLANIEKVRAAVLEHAAKPDQEEARLLLALLEIGNRNVGDALACMLMVECVLWQLDIDLKELFRMYKETPNTLISVPVKDCTKFESLPNDETVLVRPEGLQEEITKMSTQFEGSRCFVRVSGTENVARVYAEAKSQEAATEIASKVVELLKEKFT